MLHLFSASALALTANEPESATRTAEVLMSQKYKELSDRYISQAIDVESSDVTGQDTDAFISRVGSLDNIKRGERHEAEFLHQCLSLARVRRNVKSVTQDGRPNT